MGAVEYIKEKPRTYNTEYLNKRDILQTIKTSFEVLSECGIPSQTFCLVKDRVIKDIEDMKPCMNDYIAEVKDRIPEALYDSVSEQLIRDQCLSIWIACLECLDEMRDAWEEVNGENLIWVPGHFEKKEKV